LGDRLEYTPTITPSWQQFDFQQEYKLVYQRGGKRYEKPAEIVPFGKYPHPVNVPVVFNLKTEEWQEGTRSPEITLLILCLLIMAFCISAGIRYLWEQRQLLHGTAPRTEKPPPDLGISDFPAGLDISGSSGRC
jgi:hypothetical protein